MQTKVAIIGRPNVGKSTLFNRLIGRKKAIVHSSPGTTRDRNDYEVLWKNKKFIITDTAGWSSDVSVFSKDMARQLVMAVEQAEIIVFVTDAKSGIHPLDMQIAQVIRQSEKKTVLAVNKIDNQKDEAKGYEFYQLGFDDAVFISAAHGRAINDLLDMVWRNVKRQKEDKQKKELLKIILVGKPNVGKSSFINAAAKEERSIVHDIAGATRDSLTVSVIMDDKEYLLTDTAGLHRGNKAKDDMQYLSSLSANHAIDDADIAVLMIDASQGVGETESKIAGILDKKGKAIVIAVNKWDLIEENKEDAVKYFTAQIRQKIKFMDWAEIIFLSAKTGQRIEKVFKQAQEVYEQYIREIPKEDFNAAIRDAISARPYISKGKTLKFKNYAQTGIKPPFFVFSVNDMELVHFSYERYIENFLRSRFAFKGTPIILKFRKNV